MQYDRSIPCSQIDRSHITASYLQNTQRSAHLINLLLTYIRISRVIRSRFYMLIAVILDRNTFTRSVIMTTGSCMGRLRSHFIKRKNKLTKHNIDCQTSTMIYLSWKCTFRASASSENAKLTPRASPSLQIRSEASSVKRSDYL